MFDRLFGSNNPPRTLAISRLNLAEKGYNPDGSRRSWYDFGIGNDRSSYDYHAVLGGTETTRYEGTERKLDKNPGLWLKYSSEKNLGHNIRDDPQGFRELVQGQNADIAMGAFLGLAETVTLRTLRKNPSKHMADEVMRNKDPEQLKKDIELEYFFAGRPKPDPKHLDELVEGAEISFYNREARFQPQTVEEQQQEVLVKYEYLSHAKKIENAAGSSKTTQERIENGIRKCVKQATTLWPDKPDNEIHGEEYLQEKLKQFPRIDRTWEVQPAGVSHQLADEYRIEQENRKKAVEKADKTFFQDIQNDGALLNMRYDGSDILVSRNNGKSPKRTQPEFIFTTSDFPLMIQEALMQVAVSANDLKIENPSVPLFLQWKPTDENANYLHPPNMNPASPSSIAEVPKDAASSKSLSDISPAYEESLKSLASADTSNVLKRLGDHTNLMLSFNVKAELEKRIKRSERRGISIKQIRDHLDNVETFLTGTSTKSTQTEDQEHGLGRENVESFGEAALERTKTLRKMATLSGTLRKQVDILGQFDLSAVKKDLSTKRASVKKRESADTETQTNAEVSGKTDTQSPSLRPSGRQTPPLPLNEQSLPAGVERALQSGNARPYSSSGRARLTTPTGRTSPARTD